MAAVLEPIPQGRLILGRHGWAGRGQPPGARGSQHGSPHLTHEHTRGAALLELAVRHPDEVHSTEGRQAATGQRREREVEGCLERGEVDAGTGIVVDDVDGLRAGGRWEPGGGERWC